MNSPQVGDPLLDLPISFQEFIKFKDNCTYLRVVKEIENETYSEASLKQVLCYLRINITILDSSWETLVLALLRKQCILWTNVSLLQEYRAFLLHLLSAHTYYLKIVLKNLISNFTDNQLDSSSPMKSQGFLYVHRILQDVLKMVPMAVDKQMPILKNSFPYMRLSVATQVSYTKNLLYMTSYLPTHRRTILEIIIAHLIKLDVHSPKEEILQAEEIGKMDLDDESIFPLEEDKCKEESSANGLVHKLGNTLDCLMELMFEYISSFCYNKGELNWVSTKELYQDLLGIFDKIILPTHACCHIQFIMFYICSFKDCLAENFVNFLWKKVVNPNTPSVIRQVSAAYIGSALARALYIPMNCVRSCLDLMSVWIHQYINFQVTSTKNYPDISLHGAFYSVCQTLFYIFAFRHKELMETPEDFAYMRGLNLQKVVNCRLNPLKLCLPVVVKNFANIARKYQLVYCYTIIEKNQRSIISAASNVDNESSDQVGKNPLDSFFPFDPFILFRSVKYITPLFREYKGDMEEEEKHSEKEVFYIKGLAIVKSEHQKYLEGLFLVIEDEDDFLIDDEFTSYPDMDSTPNNKMDFFKYGTSPGFKT